MNTINVTQPKSLTSLLRKSIRKEKRFRVILKELNEKVSQS
jgi:hypothetical protein